MLNIREHLCATRATHALLTSYALSPALFESQIVRLLLQSGCDEILLLVDRAGYDALLTERAALAHAGCSYWIGCVDIYPRSFHPKVALLWSDDEATAYIMSANPTRGGLATNLEVVDRLTWSRTDEGSKEVKRVAGWFGRLARELPVAPPIASTIEQMLTTFPLNNAGESDDGARFVHNLDMPLLEQVALEAPTDTADVVITSPFHERRLRPVAEIADLYPRATIVVAQGDLDGTIDAAAVPASLKKRITTAVCSTPGRERRTWHAKMVAFRGKSDGVLFTGSANCTQPGFLQSFSGGGNVEAGVLRRVTTSDLDRLLDQIRLKPVAIEKFRCTVSEAKRVIPGPIISWAEIAGSVLTVDVIGTDARDREPVTRLGLLTAKGRSAIDGAEIRDDGAICRITYALDRSFDDVLRYPIVVEADVRTNAKSESRRERIGSDLLRMTFWP